MRDCNLVPLFNSELWCNRYVDFGVSTVTDPAGAALALDGLVKQGVFQSSKEIHYQGKGALGETVLGSEKQSPEPIHAGPVLSAGIAVVPSRTADNSRWSTSSPR